MKRVVAGGRNRKAVIMDSISYVTATEARHIVVSASHGGASSAEYALGQPLAAVFFNDAGVGKDEAGIAALGLLETKSVPAGTVSHTSARIGDALDMWEHGVLSHVNRSAARYGLQPGDQLKNAVEVLLKAL